MKLIYIKMDRMSKINILPKYLNSILINLIFGEKWSIRSQDGPSAQFHFTTLMLI
jgi:hypothetical protein